MHILKNLVINTSQVKKNILKVVNLKQNTANLNSNIYDCLAKNEYKDLDLLYENETIKKE